jgi:hypothetical protein
VRRGGYRHKQRHGHPLCRSHTSFHTDERGDSWRGESPLSKCMAESVHVVFRQHVRERAVFSARPDRKYSCGDHSSRSSFGASPICFDLSCAWVASLVDAYSNKKRTTLKGTAPLPHSHQMAWLLACRRRPLAGGCAHAGRWPPAAWLAGCCGCCRLIMCDAA